MISIKHPGDPHVPRMVHPTQGGDKTGVFDLEQLIERNPEVYITASDLPEKTVESIKERPGFGGIDAIKNDRIHLVDGNILSRPGPRIIEALELIMEAIHPELKN